jgi:peptidoglycan-N-acetylmuramic acid deacetylase
MRNTFISQNTGGIELNNKRIYTILGILAVIVLIMGIFTIVSLKNPHSDLRLSDLGGVYSSSSKNMDFSEELTGKLIEGSSSAQKNEITDKSTYSFDKKRCWGIARQPDNKTPRADPGAPELLDKYGAKYVGDVSKKVVYLTFDEGYENGYTDKILDTLRDNNVKAAFFITGPYLNEQQELVRRMVEEGHTVGNHTIHHPSLPEKSDAEIEEEVVGLERAFSEKFGAKMKFLRPPKGEYSERTLSITNKLGYCNLFWSFAYDDWYRDKIRGPEYAYKIVMRNLHNGEVILLHAVSKDNADALDMIIKGVRESGYEFGNVLDFAN